MAGKRHRAGGDHRRQEHSSRPHDRLLQIGRIGYKLTSAGGDQYRTGPDSTSAIATRGRRTGTYSIRPYWPAERPVDEFAAAGSVVLVGGLVEAIGDAEIDASDFIASDLTVSFFATLAFFIFFLVW